MPDYKLVSVSDPKPWQGQHGPMVGYILKLDGEDKPVHINQKPETRAPVAGMTMALELSPHKTFPDALQAKRQQLGGGASGARGSDPAERKSIQGQVAVKAAVDIARIALDSGKSTDDVLQAVAGNAKKLAALIEELAA